MPMPMRVLALAMLLAPATLRAQVVNGRVLDRGSDRPLSGLTVQLLSGSTVLATAHTDTAGLFVTTTVVAGNYRLSVRREGRLLSVSREFAVGTPDTTHVEVRVLSGALRLDPVVAVAAPRRLPAGLAGFYERAERNRGGRFWTRERIDARRATRTSDLLWDVGVGLGSTRRGGTTMRNRGCEPSVWIDGRQVPLNATSLDELLQPHDIEGIEIYSGPAAVPAEFMRRDGPSCGAVVFWTRYRN